MITVAIDKYNYTFPSNWDELSSRQFLAIVKNMGALLFQSEVTESDLYAQKIITVQQVLGAPAWLFKKLNSDQLFDLAKLLDFVKVVDLNKQLLPKVIVKTGAFSSKTFIGPDAGLDTSSFDEFIMADTYFVNISSKKNMDFAYNLFAMLYRPIREDLKEFKASDKWDGDERESFNSTKCLERVDFFKKHLPYEYILATVYFYWGFREKHLLGYTTLFPKRNPEEKQSKNNYGWAATRLELSGHKFGNYQETGKENWRNIIFDMHREEEKRQKREKELQIARMRAKK